MTQKKFAKPSPRTEPIVALLKAGTHSCEQIAQQLGVSLNVVLGVNSHFQRGRYGTPIAQPKVANGRRVRTDRGWTYLLVSHCGATYIGATTDLRHRFRTHNSDDTPGWTRGRKWLLLGVRRFNSRREAFDLEASLKRSGKARGEWIDVCLPRAGRLQLKRGLPDAWLQSLTERCRRLQANDR